MRRIGLPAVLMLSIAVMAVMAVTAAPARADPDPPASRAAPAVQTLSLPTPDGRNVPVLVVAPAQPVATVLFSHGGGTSLAAMRPVIDRLAAAGLAVVAPTHTDSLDMPAATRSNLQGAFPTRIGDMQLASAFAAQRFPGLSQAALGHSYGALTGLVAGGAFTPMVPGRVSAVRAVVMFSSPGPIPGLSQAPKALDQVTVPTLLVTGTADVVPGFVADPAAHLTYFDPLPAGDHTALIVRGASHDFIAGGQPGFDQAWAQAIDFLRSRLTGDSAAAARFASARGDAQIEVRRR